MLFRSERQEFLEHEAAAGLDNLGEGIVYSTIMALPAPTAPTRPGIPIMHELPRRVDGLHPRLAALEAMQEGRYHGYHEYVLPEMVPARLVPEFEAASSLCKINKGLRNWIKRIRNGKNDKKVNN